MMAEARHAELDRPTGDSPTSAALPFVPVRVVAAGSRPDALADVRTAGGAIEILLGDAIIRVAKGVDAAALAAVGRRAVKKSLVRLGLRPPWTRAQPPPP